MVQKEPKRFVELNHFGPGGFQVYIEIQGPMVPVVVAESISCVCSLDPIIYCSFVPQCINGLEPQGRRKTSLDLRVAERQKV